MGVKQYISPSTRNTSTRSEDMTLIVTRESNTTKATHITWEGIPRALSHMNRAVRLEFSATPTIVIEGTTKKLDIV
jgi:hypothetical protein